MRRDRRFALLFTAVFHLLLLLIALWIQFQTPQRMQRPILLHFVPPPERHTVAAPPPAPKSVQQREQPKLSPPAIRPPMESPVVERRDTVQQPRRPRMPTSALEPELTYEEAFAELNRLLDRHPQYRRLIFREMFAGDGMVRDWQPKTDLRLTELLRMEKWRSSWEYEQMKRGSGGGYFGPYDPVHGYSRDQKLGVQVNIFELLKFLKSLIGE